MRLARTLIDVRPLRTSPVFRRLLIGRTVSVLGSFMTMVTVMYQVWDMTQSTIWTGAVGLAQALPMVVFGLFAGAWVDRGDRRRIFLLATVGQAAFSLLLAVQGFTGHVPVAGVLGLVATQSCCSAVGGPAAGVFVPRLLPKDQVAAGLALQQVTGQAMMLVGPAVGSILLGWAGIGTCYLVDALSFGLAFYGAFGLPALPPAGEPSRAGLHGVLDGLRFLAGHRAVRGALITDLAATVLSMPTSLFPLVNAERFGGSPHTLGLCMSALAVGGTAASALSGAVTRLGRPAGDALWRGDLGSGARGLRPDARSVGRARAPGRRRGRRRRLRDLAQHDRADPHAGRPAGPGHGGRADRRPGRSQPRQPAGRCGRGLDVGTDRAGQRRAPLPARGRLGRREGA